MLHIPIGHWPVANGGQKLLQIYQVDLPGMEYIFSSFESFHFYLRDNDINILNLDLSPGLMGSKTNHMEENCK
jgi:hypothetical protein